MNSISPLLYKDLSAMTRGKVTTAEDMPVNYRSNFEGLQKLKPKIVLETNKPEDVAKVLQFSKKNGLPVSVRGEGHGFGSMGLGTEILLAYKSSLQATIENDTVKVSGSANWADLEHYLNSHGRSVPVLTNHPQVTIGGSLSTGGYGERSLSHYGQIDNVLGFTLALPDGDVVEVNPDVHPNLFFGALAGYGQMGVILDARLRTISYQRDVHVYRYAFAGITMLFDFLQALTGQKYPDYFSAYYDRGMVAFLGWNEPAPGFSTFAESGADLGIRKDWGNRAALSAKVYDHNNHPYHIWRNYGLDKTGAFGFSQFLEKEVLSSESFRTVGGRLLLFAVANPKSKPHHFYLDPIGQEMHGLAFGFGLHFYPTADNVRLATELQDKIMAVAFSYASRPYLGTLLETPEKIKVSIFGEGLAEHRRLKNKLDPDHLLNKELLI